MIRLSAGDLGIDLPGVRLADGRFGAALPDGVPWLVEGAGVGLTVEHDPARAATVAIARSGRTWTEVRGRLREELGPVRRRLHRAPDVVLVLALD